MTLSLIKTNVRVTAMQVEESPNKGEVPMLLRDHPLMRYHGLSNWPPAWSWIDGLENKYPIGEIGILKSVVQSHVLPANRCFLTIDHEGSSYMGCLLFDDIAFCRQITEILQSYCNRSISDIGSSDISSTLVYRLTSAPAMLLRDHPFVAFKNKE